MSEIAYEGNLFPMVGPMINAHWQHVFPRGALLGHGSCVTPPPQRCPLFLWEADIPQGEDKLEMLLKICWGHYIPQLTTEYHHNGNIFYPYFKFLKVVICWHELCKSCCLSWAGDKATVPTAWLWKSATCSYYCSWIFIKIAQPKVLVKSFYFGTI